MGDNTPSKSEEKPFSVLERFRQLKKEKEQSPATAENIKQPETVGTVFQASTSSPKPQNGEFGRGRRGRGSGRGRGAKRSFNETQPDNYSKKRAQHHQGQREPDVGITEFIREGPGFSVILKQRYTDFHVNEIDTQGQVVKLTSTEVPEDIEKAEIITEEEDPSIMPPEQWVKLKDIIDNNLSTTIDIEVTDLDKQERQTIHKAVKKRFGSNLSSNTKEVDGKKFIEIGSTSGVVNHRFCSWPRGRPEYLHFFMLKENCEMNDALTTISRFTFVKPTKFGYAGTKDKRAVTTQQVCTRRVTMDRFGKCAHLRGIAVGNYSYRWNNLRLGDLNGNRFRIALRHVKVSDEVIQEAVERFKTTGFINYFGLQRFGQSALVPTYSIGKAILKNDWGLAVELVLKPRPGEFCHEDVSEAREIWWKTKDAAAATKPLTRKDKSIEGKILQGLRKHGPKAYQNAFDMLPQNTVTLFLHSYQSLVWNRVVSRRIQEHGLKVLPGDLVKVASWMIDEDDIKEPKDTEEDSDDEDVSKADDDEGHGPNIEVRVLSAEEAQSASIYNVVYPLPGDNIQMPKNQVAEYFKEALAQDGHSLECFSQVNRKYGMSGSYRLMMEKAEELSWYTRHYSDLDEDLILSDLSLLKGNQLPPENPEAPHKALILEFNLKSSCYATMAVRELTKCETSTSNQAMLTNQAREEDLAAKKRKLDEQKCDLETVSVEEKTNENSEEKSAMETEEASKETEPEAQNTNGDTDEEKERNKREAEADNVINRYLESNYH